MNSCQKAKKKIAVRYWGVEMEKFECGSKQTANPEKVSTDQNRWLGINESCCCPDSVSIIRNLD